MWVDGCKVYGWGAMWYLTLSQPLRWNTIHQIRGRSLNHCDDPSLHAGRKVFCFFNIYFLIEWPWKCRSYTTDFPTRGKIAKVDFLSRRRSMRGYILTSQGRWATPWSAKEMLDGQHQRVDICDHARFAHNGLLQKRLEDHLRWTVLYVPPPPRRRNRSRDWTELNWFWPTPDFNNWVECEKILPARASCRTKRMTLLSFSSFADCPAVDAQIHGTDHSEGGPGRHRIRLHASWNHLRGGDPVPKRGRDPDEDRTQPVC